MPSKRILLVNDHRETNRLLRTTLETLGADHIMVEVPSGEEAVLEMGRGGFDLLITGYRLPGMTGIDVIKRMQRIDPKTKTILIGESGGPLADDAQRLGAAYFPKPLRMDAVVQAIQGALGTAPRAAPAPAAADDQPGIAERLSTLRRDLGANAVFLVDQQAQIVVRAGDVTRLDTDAAMKQLMTAFSASMKLCRMLGGFIPSNVHFFDGDDYDIYAANVGQFFALVIIFDGDRGAGQMGPVMRYGRQCADDLLNSLVLMGVAEEPEPAPALASLPRAAPAHIPAPAGVEMRHGASARGGASAQAAAPPPPAAEPEPAPAPAEPARPLTAEELAALDSALQKAASVDAGSFWDTAVEEAETGVRPDAISWEDAEKLGLIPKG